jgi:predicted small lipoprotein YifL
MRTLRSILVLLVLFLLAGCGHVPTVLPQQAITSLPEQDISPTLLDDAPTEIPYPLPTLLPPPTVWPTPISAPQPTLVILGAQDAPPEEQEAYSATRLIVAPVGDGPGKIGYRQEPETPRVWADRFVVDSKGNVYILDKANDRVAQFDSAGQFVRSIPYTHEWYIDNLAVGEEQRIYLNSWIDGIRLIDQDGKLLQQYLIPKWFQSEALAMKGQGTLWVQGRTDFPSCQFSDLAYTQETVPLGNYLGEFDEEQQRAGAVAGCLLSTGDVVIGYNDYVPELGHSIVFIADPKCIPTHQFLLTGGIVGIDQWGNWYATETSLNTEIARMYKYDPQGRHIASFDLPSSDTGLVVNEVQVTKEGVVYVLTWDFTARSIYQVTRWQR